MRRRLPPLPSLLLGACLLVACQRATTVVIVALPGADGREVPVAQQAMVMLPYDRDSVAAALTAAWPVPRPDTLPLTTLLDTLRADFSAFLVAPPAEKEAARLAMETRRAAIESRIEPLRAAQHAWRDSAWRTYDSVTFALVRRLARDPFSDTTDTRGIAVVAPARAGPWWVTISAWDAADPYTEWYWNLPLAGDTLRLTAANAAHRRRY